MQHYKHIVIKYSHVRLKITTRYLTISQRESLCLRLSHVWSVWSVVLWQGETLFYCAPDCVFSEPMPMVDDSRPLPAKQTPPSAPCRLRTCNQCRLICAAESQDVLCDYLLDKWGLWRTSDFDITLVRRTSDIISLFRSLYRLSHTSCHLYVAFAFFYYAVTYNDVLWTEGVSEIY